MGMSVTEEILEGGKHWSMRINRGMCLQLSDLEGGGCAGMIAFNAMDPLERLNIPDSLKCQHTFKLTKGNCLYSDMGRILFSIIDDSHGWHDAVCGSTSRESTVQALQGLRLPRPTLLPSARPRHSQARRSQTQRSSGSPHSLRPRWQPRSPRNARWARGQEARRHPL